MGVGGEWGWDGGEEAMMNQEYVGVLYPSFDTWSTIPK